MQLNLYREILYEFKFEGKMRKKGMVSPTGFEPVASKLGILRSILLSYEDKIGNLIADNIHNVV